MPTVVRTQAPNAIVLPRARSGPRTIRRRRHIVVLVVASLSVLLIAGPTAEAAPTTWSQVPSATRAVAYSALSGVSCSGGTCIAVGYSSGRSRDRTLVESWNGTAWTVERSPSPDWSDQFDGVACPSPTWCVAVGSSGSGSRERTLVETWNGTTWEKVHTGFPGVSAGLSGVSCASPDDCIAVGSYTTAQEPGVLSATWPLVDSWNGKTWDVELPPATNPTYNMLLAVSCPEIASCVAVGDADSQTLAESWNGSTWSIDPSPSPGVDNRLSDVTCSDATDCVAVGSAVTGVDYQTLVENWDGTAWTVTPSPDPSTVNTLQAVSCTDPSDCVAVGETIPDTVAETLVETWDGSTWTTTPSPDPSTRFNGLFSVWLTGSGTGLAVGGASLDTTRPKHVQTFALVGSSPPT